MTKTCKWWKEVTLDTGLCLFDIIDITPIRANDRCKDFEGKE